MCFDFLCFLSAYQSTVFSEQKISDNTISADLDVRGQSESKNVERAVQKVESAESTGKCSKDESTLEENDLGLMGLNHLSILW